MKKLIYLAPFYLMLIGGCSKDEPVSVQNNVESSVMATVASTLTVPIIPGYTPKSGTEPSHPIPYPIRPNTITRSSSSHWATPHPLYIKNTCLLKISHLEEGSTYHQINNDKLNIAFYSGDDDKKPIFVRRLKPTTPSPYGWTSYWNTPRNVENEHPEVLFTPRFARAIIIVLSKPCETFGFELSPNIQNKKVRCAVYWGVAALDNSKGSYGYQIETPCGARLFERQGGSAFTVVTIWINPPGESPRVNAEGMAIANIRYKLAE